MDVPRQCVITGTTNRNDWSTDDTGDRRYWPIRCGIITLDTLSAARDQLFAEAVHAFRAGAPWWTIPVSAREVQADRLPDHAWTPLVLSGLMGLTETTMAEVLQRLGFKPEMVTDRAERMAGSILRRAGWVSKPARRQGQPPRRIWLPPDELL